MTIEQIVENLKSRKPFTSAHKTETEKAIDGLTHSERRAVQKLIGPTPAPRNLFYDYDLQQWI